MNAKEISLEEGKVKPVVDHLNDLLACTKKMKPVLLPGLMIPVLTLKKNWYCTVLPLSVP